MPPSVSRTDFEFNISKAERSIDTLINKVTSFENLTKNLGGNTISLGGTSQIKREVEDLGRSFSDLTKEIFKSNNATLKNTQQIEKERAAFTKAANADILRMQRENARSQAEIEKQLTNQLKAENTLRTNDLKRANNEAIRELKNEQSAKKEVLAQSAQYLNSSRDAVSRFNRQSLAGPGLNLSSFQKTNLSYQANDVISGLAMGQSPLQILAQQGGQIAQIFNAEQAATLVATYGRLIPILAAGAAAIAITYKVTGDIREESERRLGVEEKLAVAYGKQSKAAFDIRENYRIQTELAEKNRAFNEFLESNNNLGGLQTLIDRKKKLEIYSSVHAGGDPGLAKRESDEALRLGESISALQKIEREAATRSADNAARLRWEGLLSQQTRDAEAAKKRAEDFAKSVEKGKEKVNELGKTWTSTFNDLYSKTGANNPIFTVMNEGNLALIKLRENIKGLPTEMQRAALGMQTALTANTLFSVNLDNKLESFNLRNKANEYRNYRNPAQDKQIFDSIVNRSINGLGGDYSAGNSTAEIYRKTFGSDLVEKRGGVDKLTDADKRSIYEVASLTNLTADRKMDLSVNRDSLISMLARERLGTNQDFLTQSNIQGQIDIIKGSNPLNAEQRDAANRRLISLAQNTDITKLTDLQRNVIADVYDQRAKATENYQKDANKLLADQLAAQKETNRLQAEWMKLAEKEGIKAVLEIIDKTNGGASIRVGTTPSQFDTQKEFGGN